MNNPASSPSGQTAHSHRDAYLLDCEGAYDVFCQGLCFNQGDFNVSVDLCVIWPVSHTLHLRGRTEMRRVSRWLSVSSRLIWLSRSNKPKGNFGGISVQGVLSRPGIGNVHGANLTPRGTGAIRNNGSTFSCRAPDNFQVHYQIDLGELGGWWYPHITDENTTQVRRFWWLGQGHVASFLPLAEWYIRLGPLISAEQR